MKRCKAVPETEAAGSSDNSPGSFSCSCPPPRRPNPTRHHFESRAAENLHRSTSAGAALGASRPKNASWKNNLATVRDHPLTKRFFLPQERVMTSVCGSGAFYNPTRREEATMKRFFFMLLRDSEKVFILAIPPWAGPARPSDSDRCNSDPPPAELSRKPQ